MTPEQYARVKELFGEVVDLDADQRRRILDEQCAEDADLREAVESLLKHDDPRTIIQSDDSTLKDFSPTTHVAPRRRKLTQRLRGLGGVTQDLGPRGLLALGGLASCLLLALIGYIGQRYLHNVQMEIRREVINQLVDGKVLAVRMWLDHEQEKVRSWARSNNLRKEVQRLVESAEDSDELSAKFSDSAIQQVLRDEVTALAGRQEHFSIWDRQHRLIADAVSNGERVGQYATPWGSGVLAAVFEGESILFPFDRQNSISRLDDSVPVTPQLAIVTPIRDDAGKIIAALQIYDEKSREKATRILQTLWLGESGESYVFNSDGLSLTDLRFTEPLEQAGLIEERSDSSAQQRVHLRDPGGDITAGFEVTEPPGSLPLTKMVRLCLSGNDGIDLDGYRDYRGVMVVGAWRWLEDLQIGVAIEWDAAEVDPSMRVVRSLALATLTLLGACLCVSIGSFYSIQRLRANFGENQRLGQYQLEKQIGEGGMGKVFKARHELLKRPTAIKLLKPKLVEPDSIARFEREAQLVSQLEHFNTIRVFDYGVSEQRIFYLVMEYIDGMTLSDLIELARTLAPARAMLLLRQILFSLREAHEAGVVHRDLKPGNVMVCVRGGIPDIIKVLDFGLVKPIESTAKDALTATNLIAGTPQYMAPERLTDRGTNDPRLDLYSFGAIAFFLLTGRDAITGASLQEILHQLANIPPPRPSQFTDQPIPPELDDLIYRCLAKDPKQRPASAQEIIDELDCIPSDSVWDEAQAQKWWADHGRTSVT